MVVLLLDAGQALLVVKWESRILMLVLLGRKDAALERWGINRAICNTPAVQIAAVGQLFFHAQHFGD